MGGADVASKGFQLRPPGPPTPALPPQTARGRVTRSKGCPEPRSNSPLSQGTSGGGALRGRRPMPFESPRSIGRPNLPQQFWGRWRAQASRRGRWRTQLVPSRGTIEFPSPPCSLWGRGRERGAPWTQRGPRRRSPIHRPPHHPFTRSPVHPLRRPLRENHRPRPWTERGDGHRGESCQVVAPHYLAFWAAPGTAIALPPWA